MIARRMALLGLVLLTAGCGFHPVYGAHQGSTPALAAVYVDIIPDRSGQLLRQALQARLEGSTADVPKRFVLGVSYREAVQGLGLQADNSTTRNRDIGIATWSLRLADNPAVRLAGGSVRSLDGYNIIDEQFFYADLQEDAAQHRLAQSLADQIVMAMSVYFDQHPG